MLDEPRSKKVVNKALNDINKPANPISLVVNQWG